MRIAITGASGLIGRALSKKLRAGGHEVLSIGRYRQSHPPDIRWSVPHGQLDPRSLEGLDAVEKRWSYKLGDRVPTRL